MEIRDSEMSLVFFILYICKMKKIMKGKNQVVPDEVLSKEFLSRFKTEADVSKFLKQLHAQVLEKMLEGLDNLEKKWGRKHPYAIISWKNNWDDLTVFFQYTLKIR